MAKEKKIVSVPKHHVLPRLIFTLTLFIPLIFQRVIVNNDCQGIIIRSKDLVLCSSIADEPKERSLGLSGVENMKVDQAMLFIFEEPGKYGFWMKDMLFPIDIIWLNENKEVSHIEKAVSQYSYPKVYTPNVTSKFVIEVKAGLAEEKNITLGTTFSW